MEVVRRSEDRGIRKHREERKKREGWREGGGEGGKRNGTCYLHVHLS